MHLLPRCKAYQSLITISCFVSIALLEIPHLVCGENAVREKDITAEQYVAQKAEEAARETRERSDTASQDAVNLPDAAKGYDWKKMAVRMKERRWLDDDAIASLEKNKAAYGPALKQSFQPYLMGPVFICSNQDLI